MPAKESFQMEHEKAKKRKGLRFGPFALFLLAIVVLASIATIIILTVFFVEQGQEISDLQNEVNVFESNLSISTSVTPEATITPQPTIIPTSVAPDVIRDSYRLPEDFAPLHFDVYLQVFLPFNAAEENTTGAFTTYGETKIDIQCKHSTNVLILHAWNLTIYSTRVVSSNALHQDLLVESVDEDDLRHFLIIRLAQNLTKGETYRVELKYTGLVVSENQGLYRSKYTLPNGDTRWLATSQLQPYKARRVFPCFDEPGIRATFDITIKHDSRFTGTYSIRRKISSQTDPANQNWTESRFERTVRMPAYLLAFLVSDFERNGTVTPEGLDFGVLSRKDAIKDATFSKNIGIKITEHLGKLFNMEYTNYNSKLDMVAVPDFDAGAMENWGLIVYREVMMLYRQGVSSVKDKKQIANVVAHELAHQWFGNAVTCSWWSEAFLNEGFASFLETPLVHSVLEEWEMEKTFTISNNRVAFDSDAYETAVPLFDPTVEKRPDIENMFGRITYQKGASVLRMIEGFMGKADFYAALTTYLAERSAAGGVATYKQLLTAFTVQMAKPEKPSATALDFNERFDEWISTNGFPLVTLKIHRQEKQNKLFLTQERFLLGNASTANVTNKRAWNIPFTFVAKTADESAEELLLQQTEATPPVWLNKTGVSGSYQIPLPVAPQWVLANIQSFGFYRINYEPSNWDALTTQLQTNHSAIHMFSRVQLIDDAFSLARKGLVDYGVPLGLMQYLSSETEYPPWSTAIDSLQYIDGMIGGSTDVLQRFMRKILGLKYDNGYWKSEDVWRDEEKEDYQELMLRLSVVESSCYNQLESCNKEASKELKEWKEANSTSWPIDPHFKGQIFCYGIRHGSVEDFEYLLWRFQQEDLHATKLNILEGLACSKNESLVQRVLAMTLDNNIVRSQDANYVLRYVSKFPAGNLLAWAFLKTHWKELPQNSRDNMISEVTGKFNTPQMLDAVSSFYASLGSDIPEKTAFDGALAKIRSNILWMSQYKDVVLQALEEGLVEAIDTTS